MSIVAYIIGTVAIALIMLVTVSVILKFFFENEQKKQLLKLKASANATVLPLRLQAFERIALLLDRIDPNQLLVRHANSSLSARQLRNILLISVRSEFDHNISQQIYISSEVWEKIVRAKEETLSLITNCAENLPETANAHDIATAILSIRTDKNPVSAALEALKIEARVYF